MTNKMAKLSLADKMRIQTLREQGLGARAIRNTYPEKRWVLSTISKICKGVDSCGSAVERKVGSGRPKTARIAENIEKVKELLCSQEECQEFIAKDEWPPNSPDLNPLDYSVWGLMLDSYNKLNPKPTSRSELKNALQNIWDALPHTPIQKAIRSFRKRLQLCVRVEGGHFEHLLK